MIFVDTSAWFAAYVEDDANFLSASSFLTGAIGELVTTDYIVDETLTLLRTRRKHARALSFGQVVFESRGIEVERIAAEDLQRAWTIFRSFQDKGWSFTDCTSFAVMERLGIKQAFAFDRHFHQFGNVEVVPS